MSEVVESLSQISRSVPTLELTPQVKDGKTYLLAGTEAVFICRSNELGEAYGSLVMQSLKLLPEALAAMKGATLPAAQTVDDSHKSEVIARISRAIAMSAEMTSRAEMLGKLVFSAIEPFLKGGETDAVVSSVALPGAQADVDVRSIRREAVQDFTEWLGSEGRLGALRGEEDLADLCAEWGVSDA
ncbi:hypothetical protein APB26_31785 [Pseudomonas aeruginosa]|uniref:hypothetical protein n=1 Tax=Pseudomonas aeruginosa TaxID=287 RepID=UPI00071B0E34|nr:hypothetical protein [Pseudomonas aeruginosa]KSQ21571.1 hypothetical protein APB26_31785 [Pseudomonas aeruginosa]RPV61239.1 hypothetical protein IPC838_18110 [Pseudomonas aeruginosa]